MSTGKRTKFERRFPIHYPSLNLQRMDQPPIGAVSNRRSNQHPTATHSKANAMAFLPESIRNDFPILQQTVHKNRQLVYFDNAATTQRPTQVIEAMNHCYRKDFSNVHRGIHSLSERMTDQFEHARQTVQRLLNAEFPEEIIFSAGTTAAINTVAHSFGESLQAGDEIIITEMEHHSNIVPWQQLAARKNLKLQWLSVSDDGQLVLDELKSLLNDRTKMVAVTAVSNVLGTINPIQEITSTAHAAGAKVMVDAAQAIPHGQLDVRKLDCDFLVFSGHKILGPSGIGILYGKRSLLDALPPFFGGGSMIHTVEKSGFTPALLPAKFEAGTPPIVEAIGLASAIQYVQQIGLPAIEQHEKALVQQCISGIQSIPGIKILGPAADDRVGLVAFSIDGINSQDLARFLDFRGFAVRAGHHCAMPLHQRFQIPNSVRASFYLYNTSDEVSHFCQTLPAVIEKLQ